jgi:hypothetical protein
MVTCTRVFVRGILVRTCKSVVGPLLSFFFLVREQFLQQIPKRQIHPRSFRYKLPVPHPGNPRPRLNAFFTQCRSPPRDPWRAGWPGPVTCIISPVVPRLVFILQDQLVRPTRPQAQSCWLGPSPARNRKGGGAGSRLDSVPEAWEIG